MSERSKSALVLVALLALSAVVALLGSLATVQNVDGWYADAAKAPWNPPNWVFGPVWSILYTVMAVAAWLVWRERDRVPVRRALVLYGVQLALNAVWTPTFFALYPALGAPALWIGLAVIVALDVVLLLTILAFRPVSRVAAWILVPYLGWVLFATSLNLALAVLN